MRSRKIRSIMIAMVMICCLFAAACSAGEGGSTPKTSATASEEPQTIPEQTTAETTAEDARTTQEPAETEAAAPDDWRAKYEALPAGLQEALIPSDVDSKDDFLAMFCKTLEGGEWSGAELAGRDMTVIDCWMTWCGPCREEMPTLQKLSLELPENIRLMGICFDGEAETDVCRTIVTQSGVTYPVLLGDDVSGSPFYLGNYTQGVPTLLFVGPDGHCFARFVGRPLTPEIEEKDALNIIINLALEKLKGE